MNIFVFIFSSKNAQEIKFMKVNSYKKGTCLIILDKYVIINMYSEFEKKK